MFEKFKPNYSLERKLCVYSAPPTKINTHVFMVNRERKDPAQNLEKGRLFDLIATSMI